ncbi:MAG: 30S ribosomal protein S4, partial [Candidatus Woesebacteria bacterium]|nr:30S ribosomal protein S4 [Candidatus Woesebacteria bacterium]
KVNIPSFQVNIGDVIALSSKLLEIPGIKKLIEDIEYETPAWLERKISVGKVVKDPVRLDIKELITEQDIVEFYSR